MGLALFQRGEDVGGLFEVSWVCVDKHFRLNIDPNFVKVLSVVGNDKRFTEAQFDLKAFDLD